MHCLQEFFLIWIKIALRFVCYIPTDVNLVQVMAWHQKGAKPLPELSEFTHLTDVHICHKAWIN